MESRASIFVAVLLAAAVFSGYMASQTDFQVGETITDCRNSSYTCEEKQLSQVRNLEGCASGWRPWYNYSRLNCTYTDEGKEDLGMIADPSNFVDIDRSRTKFNSTKIPVATDSDPWDLELGSNGTIYWTTKAGKVFRYEGDSREIIGDFRYSVNSEGENGLLGMALDPDFEENNKVYLMYTYEKTDEPTLVDGNNIFRQKVTAFELVNGRLRKDEELLDIPSSVYHGGGRLEFGPDEKLYVSTGEAEMEYQSVNESFLGGKVLRLNTDGSIPEDNPIEGSYAYSLGHRNPQGIAWNPETGSMFTSEHGPTRYDELNRVRPGEDQGWAYYKCSQRFEKSISYWDDLPAPETYEDSYEPVHCWNNYTMAPSGMTFVNDTDSRFHGDLFVAGLRGAHIERMEFDGDELVDREIFYISDDEDYISLRLRDVEYFNGSFYVLGDKKGLVKLEPKTDNGALLG